jgi:hypothetical protein
MASQAGRVVLRLLIPGSWMPANVSAQAQSRLQGYAHSCPVPATCPMGRSPGVLRGYSRTRSPDRPPAAALVRRTPALIPKLIVKVAVRRSSRPGYAAL